MFHFRQLTTSTVFSSLSSVQRTRCIASRPEGLLHFKLQVTVLRAHHIHYLIIDLTDNPHISGHPSLQQTLTSPVVPEVDPGQRSLQVPQLESGSNASSDWHGCKKQPCYLSSTLGHVPEFTTGVRVTQIIVFFRAASSTMGAGLRWTTFDAFPSTTSEFLAGAIAV